MPFATHTILPGFLLFGREVCLHGCSSKAQPLLLTLDEGYLLTAAPPDLERRIASLGPPAPAQPPLLGCGLLLPGADPGLGRGVTPLSFSCAAAAWHSAAAPDLGHGVTPLGHTMCASCSRLRFFGHPKKMSFSL